MATGVAAQALSRRESASGVIPKKAAYTVSISRLRPKVGARLEHEEKGLGTLTEVQANGNWVIRFDEPYGKVHTYKPSSHYKLNLVRRADGSVPEQKGSRFGFSLLSAESMQERFRAAFEVELNDTVAGVFAKNSEAILGSDPLRQHARWPERACMASPRRGWRLHGPRSLLRTAQRRLHSL